MKSIRFSVRHLLLLMLYVCIGMVVMPIMLAYWGSDPLTIASLGKENYDRAILGQRVGGAFLGLYAFFSPILFKRLSSKLKWLFARSQNYKIKAPNFPTTSAKTSSPTSPFFFALRTLQSRLFT